MMEKLNPNDSQDNRTTSLIEKINELIDIVNGISSPTTHIHVTKSENEQYCPQAEEALKQVAQLEKRFGDHVHYAREMQYPTSTPDNPDVHSS